MESETTVLLRKVLEGQQILRAELTALGSRVADIEANMATKADIEALRAEMATKAELEALRAEMATKADLVALRAEMATKTDAEEIKAQQAETNERLADLELKVDHLGAKWFELDREVYRLRRK